MATIVTYGSPNFSGFHTDTFFIPGDPDAAPYERVLAGGGASVTVTYAALRLQFTYVGADLVFDGTEAVSGLVRQIVVAEYDTQAQGYRVTGTLTLPKLGQWLFASAFTTAYAEFYAEKGHRITGTGLRDTLYGGAQDDVVRPESHDDLVYTGAGNDILELRSQGPWDTVPTSATLSADLGAGAGDVLRVLGTGGALNLREASLAGIEAIQFMGPSRLHLDAEDLGRGIAFDARVTSEGGTLVVWQRAGDPLSVAGLQVSGALVVDLVGTASADVQLGGRGTTDILRGGQGSDWLRGQGAADTLYGGAGNDTLDGGAGADQMMGGEGDDLYIASAGDVIVEEAGGGVDHVRTAADLVLASFVEHVTVIGGVGRQVLGNEEANQMTGDTGGDSLTGAAGEDIILGLGGADLLQGGSGNDLLNGGIGQDTLRGDRDDDWISGGAGNDSLVGGDGADRFLFSTGGGTDRIRDFATNGEEGDVIDLIDLNAVTGWADLVANHMSQQGLNVVINAGNGDVLILERVWLPLLEASDFLF